MASPNTYTTTDLVELIKILGHVPESNSTFTSARLLLLADLELETAIAAMLKKIDQGFFQTYVEYDQNVSGEYDLPSDAVASTLYVVQIRNGQAIWPVSRQEIAEQTTTTFPSGGNFSFALVANRLKMLPADFGGVLRLTYERRCSKLVLPSACARVSAINSDVITVESVPTGWVVGSTVDLQRATPHFDVLDTLEVTDITGLDITLDSAPTELAVGDYLCLENQTCIPQIPVEFHKLLAQRVVCKIYELQGYFEKLKAAQGARDEMVTALLSVITPRTQAAPTVINPGWGGRKPGGAWGRFNPPASP
jgi:hypothetical protein